MQHSTAPSMWGNTHGSKVKADVDGSAEIDLTLYLKPESFEFNPDHLHDHPGNRNYLGHADLKKHFGCSKDIRSKLQAYAKENGIKFSGDANDFNRAKLTGTLGEFSKLFNVEFKIFETLDGQEHLGYTGELDLPGDLEEHIVFISGLEEGLTQESRISAPRSTGVTAPKTNQALRAVPPQGYTPSQVETAYNFPENDASGECIGIVALGGSYKKEDIDAFFKLFDRPAPDIEWVGEKFSNPGGGNVNDLEMTMDIQLAASLAPGAKIVIYAAKSIPEAIHLAVTDKTHRPSVLSISWALSELQPSASYLKLLEYNCALATKLGITILAASGDYGALNKGATPNVMLPAAHPLVLGIGGTKLEVDPHNEVVWDTKMGQQQVGSGGGYSVRYPVPVYQTGAVNYYRQHFFPYGNQGRGVPDIAANSDQETGYHIIWNDQPMKGFGTSASTPVLAALLARMNKAMGHRLGWVHPYLYQLEATKAYQQVTQGNNGIFPAAWGWSAATGLGTPNGKVLLEKMQELMQQPSPSMMAKSRKAEEAA